MMIKALRYLLVAALPLCLVASCSDDDDTVGEASLPVGTTFDVSGIYYVVTDSLARTCGVTYGAGKVTSMLYSGVVDIPSIVRHDGCTYTVTSIEKQAFFVCRVTEVHIPTTVTTIATLAFEGCYLLTTLDIPSSVTYIGPAAFSGCSALTAMVIPSSVTSLDYATFEGCSALTEVLLPSTMTEFVGVAMFGVCTSLQEITIPDLVGSIPERTFERCAALTTVTLGRAVARVDKEAFTYCSSLSSLSLRNPSPPSCASDAFTNVPISSCVLYVPKGSKEAYATADVWKTFINIEEIE